MNEQDQKLVTAVAEAIGAYDTVTNGSWGRKNQARAALDGVRGAGWEIVREAQSDEDGWTWEFGNISYRGSDG